MCSGGAPGRSVPDHWPISSGAPASACTRRTGWRAGRPAYGPSRWGCHSSRRARRCPRPGVRGRARSCSSISRALAASAISLSRVMFLVPVSAWSSPAPSPESRIRPDQGLLGVRDLGAQPQGLGQQLRACLRDLLRGPGVLTGAYRELAGLRRGDPRLGDRGGLVRRRGRARSLLRNHRRGSRRLRGLRRTLGRGSDRFLGRALCPSCPSSRGAPRRRPPPHRPPSRRHSSWRPSSRPPGRPRPPVAAVLVRALLWGHRLRDRPSSGDALRAGLLRTPSSAVAFLAEASWALPSWWRPPSCDRLLGARSSGRAASWRRSFAPAFFPAAVAVATVFAAAFFVAAAFVAAVFVCAAFAAALPPAFFLFAAPFAERSAPMDLPDADCCTAVFFATMAAAPSHIVILLANRAGTINRLQSRGNGARRPIRPPRAVPRGEPASVVPSSPPGNPPSRPSQDREHRRRRHSGQSARLPRRPATPRPRAPENRSAAVRRAPYTGRSEKRGWGRVAAYAARSDPGTVRARGPARREDHPGAAGRKPQSEPRRQRPVDPASRPQ